MLKYEADVACLLDSPGSQIQSMAGHAIAEAFHASQGCQILYRKEYLLSTWSCLAFNTVQRDTW